MFRIRPRLVSFLALGLIALTGIVLILKTMPQGLGLSDDSIAYIAGARSMLAGEGYREAWLASDQPVTHFPPAFSSLLALVGLLGIDPLHGARWVNALLFGLNAALLGILAWRMTPWLIAGLVLGRFVYRQRGNVPGACRGDERATLYLFLPAGLLDVRFVL